MDQRNQAEAFKALHHVERILVLPNAWDAASAKMFEIAGAAAVATTSSGVAASLGYPDGQHIPRELLFTIIGRITAVVDIPVSVDAEAGYGETPAEVAETVRGVIDRGAVGINLEDRMTDPDLLVAKLTAAKEAGVRSGVPVFVNARPDVYLFRHGDPATFFDETLRRVGRYEAAGADGVFVPGLQDLGTVARLVRAIQLPLNILAGPGAPPIAELHNVGVKRVSVGGGPMRAALTLTRRIAGELLTSGTYDGLAGAIPHAEVNAMFAGK